MRIQFVLPIFAALGLAACTVNTAPASPGYVAVQTPAPQAVITTQPAPPATVILR